MGNELYVGKLSYETTDEELRSAFSPHATVVGATIIRDRDTDRSSVDPKNQVEQMHYLWGTTVAETTANWALCSEDRGAQFWLPACLGLDPATDLPLRLAIRQHVGRDPRSGLAGIVDAVIVGLANAQGKVMAPPS